MTTEWDTLTPNPGAIQLRTPTPQRLRSLQAFVGEYEDPMDCPLWPESFRSPALRPWTSVVVLDATTFRLVLRSFKRRTSLSRGIF